MGQYKLTYFNLRGIAEPIRFLFAYGKMPFIDNHIDAKTWLEVKKNIKWQQLPVLEFDGKVLTQTLGIQNYLQNLFGLSPNDPWDQAKCDEVIGAFVDLRIQIKPFIIAKFVENSSEKETEIKESLMSSSIPLFLGNVNDILEEIRKDKKEAITTDFTLGGIKPTAADFHLAHFTELWETIFEEPNFLEKYELLKKVQKAVFDLPEISKWLQERPDFPF